MDIQGSAENIGHEFWGRVVGICHATRRDKTDSGSHPSLVDPFRNLSLGRESSEATVMH